MATPAVASVAIRFPNASIHVATGTWSREAWLGNPRIRGIIDASDFIGGRVPNPSSFTRFVQRLRRLNFDTALVLERSWWPGLAIALAGIPTRAGLSSGWRGITYTRRFPVPPVIHEAELYLRVAALVGAPVSNRPMEFEPPAEARVAAHGWLSRNGLIDRPFAILHPGGGTNPGMSLLSKRWPADRFAEVASRLSSRGVRPVIVGGPTDRASVDDVFRQSPVGTIRTDSGMSLAEIAALARVCQLYIGNDSGPTHLARAAGAPTVVVFGPSDERRYGPWGTIANGAPAGEAVAEPLLGLDSPAPAWLDRDAAAVSVDRVWAAIERVVSQASGA